MGVHQHVFFCLDYVLSQISIRRSYLYGSIGSLFCTIIWLWWRRRLAQDDARAFVMFLWSLISALTRSLVSALKFGGGGFKTFLNTII